jgi:tetratricopeptide (TPR) repeat protein
VTSSEARKREQAIDQAVATGDLRRATGEAEDYCATTETLPEGDARSPRFRARYLAAQVDLAAGRLGTALSRVQTLLPRCDRLAPELAARLRLLAAEALARLDRPEEARAQLALVPAAPLDDRPLLRLRALRVRLWLGDLALLGEELVACARELEAMGDAANLALLRCEEGRARDRAGDLPAALACWRRAEELTRPLGDSAIRADVLIQLGRLDHLRGHLGTALDRFDAACRCAGDSPHAAEATLRRALVRLELGRREQAAAEAAPLLDGPPDGLPEELRPLADMARGLLTGATLSGGSDEARAYAAAQRGDAEAARSLYAAALASEPSPARRARLVLALGLLAAARRDAAEAHSWLGEAEALARSQDLPEVLARTLQVCGQMAAEEGGDEVQARRLFEEAILITEQQAGQFDDVLERVAYRWQRGSVLRQLLRSACRRGDVEAVLRYQEMERGRLLLTLLHSPAGAAWSALRRPARVEALQEQIGTVEEALAAGPERDRRRELLRRREELLLELDRAFEGLLRDRGRAPDGILPALPDLAALRRALPPGAVYVAPVVTDDELFLLAVRRDGGARVVRSGLPAELLRGQIEALWDSIGALVARYRRGLLGRVSREELDGRLDALGRGPLGAALHEVLTAGPDPSRRLIWVPEGPLHGLPVHALRLRGRYLVEDWETVWNFSAALLAHQARTRRRRRGRFRPALVVSEGPDVLPCAGREGEGVAATFLWRRRLHGPEADRRAVRAGLRRARVAHFACHADFEGGHPLAACVRLPSGEKVHALEWLGEPVARLPLLTLSACRSAEVAPVLGQEVFGLVTGLLGAGVRAVLAGLWPVTDRETAPLMWRFYRQRLTHDLAAALARAQREELARPHASPLFWAAFALHGDAEALPAAGWLGRWLGGRRRRWHARRYPDV